MTYIPAVKVNTHTNARDQCIAHLRAIEVNADSEARTRFIDSTPVECLFSITPLPSSAASAISS